MQDRLTELRQQIATKDSSLAETLPVRSAIIQARKNERTDIGIFEAQLGTTTPGLLPGEVRDLLSFTKKHQNDDTAFMSDYLSSINLIKDGIAGVTGAMEKIKAVKQKMVISTVPAEEQELSNHLQRLIHDTNKSVLATKKALETLKQDNDVFRSRHADTSEARIRENMHAALTRKFRELLADYRNLQTDYKKAVKDKIERQVKIIYPDANDRELQEIVNEADSSVAQQAIRARMTGAHESLTYAVQDIESKHRDVRRLEQSVNELHQMFVDLATLVDAQGELLDQIDYSVRNAKDYTEKADKDLVQVRINQAKSKKRACWISTCLIILTIVIVLPIVVYLTG